MAEEKEKKEHVNHGNEEDHDWKNAHYEYRSDCKEEHKGIGFGRIFFGLIILVIGIVYLLNNAGITQINLFFNFHLFWPILVIGIGLSLLSKQSWISWVLFLILILIIFGIISSTFNNRSSLNTGNNESFVIAKDASANVIDLNIKTGAGRLSITDGSSNAINGDFNSNYLSLNRSNTTNNLIQKITLDESKNNYLGMRSSLTNDLDLKLNPLTLYDLSVDSGAMEMNLDLTNILASNVDVATGASSLIITMGDNVNLSNVNIKAGASKIIINLPRTIGAYLKINSGVSLNNLNDLVKKADHYESNNYASSDKKINLDLNTGATNLSVDWY